MRMSEADGPGADRLGTVAKTRASTATRVKVLQMAESLYRLKFSTWESTSVHPLRGVEEVVDWFAAARLAPFLDPLDPRERAEFLGRYKRALGRLRRRSRRQPAVPLPAPVHLRAQGGRRRRKRALTPRMRKRADLVLVERGLLRQPRPRPGGDRGRTGQRRRQPCASPPTPLASTRAIDARAAHPWASRGGVKLAAALDAFGALSRGLACLDVGASTGGFTDVLLRGARARVVAVDVGHGQLDPRLSRRPAGAAPRRVRRAPIDRRGSARLRRRSSATSASSRSGWCAPPALALAARRRVLVGLVKPQFEVGRERAGEGRVKDPPTSRRPAPACAPRSRR